jgi:hypothetical protein
LTLDVAKRRVTSLNRQRTVLDFSFRILQPAVTLGFLLYVAAAWLTLVVPPVGRAGPPPALVVTTAAVVAAGAALGVIGGRDVLVPHVDQITAI